jgi:cysteine desulfuration protein SufE
MDHKSGVSLFTEVRKTKEMTIPDKENQIISEFSLFEDWMDKYNYLIELGKSLPLIDEKYKTDPYVITGCQSKVWLHAALENGKVLFTADSDAIITKGIVNLLIMVLSGHTPDEILAADMEFIEKIGLREHLSPTRSNGLTSMIKQMKLYALAFQAKMKSGN